MPGLMLRGSERRLAGSTKGFSDFNGSLELSLDDVHAYCALWVTYAAAYDFPA